MLSVVGKLRCLACVAIVPNAQIPSRAVLLLLTLSHGLRRKNDVAVCIIRRLPAPRRRHSLIDSHDLETRNVAGVSRAKLSKDKCALVINKAHDWFGTRLELAGIRNLKLGDNDSNSRQHAYMTEDTASMTISM